MKNGRMEKEKDVNNDGVFRPQIRSVAIVNREHLNTQKPYSPSYCNIEDRITKCSNGFESALKNVEMKFLTLKEHLKKMREYIEISAIKRDNEKTEIIEDIKRIETQLRLTIDNSKEESNNLIDNRQSILQKQFKQILDSNDKTQKEINEIVNDAYSQADKQLKALKEKEISNRHMIGSSLCDVKIDIDSKTRYCKMTINKAKEDIGNDYIFKSKQIEEIEQFAQEHLTKEKQEWNMLEDEINKLIPNINECLMY